VRQGRSVADAAADAGARHVVYGSAGVGRSGTGVGQWESKLRVKEHMLSRGLPLTVLRPMALMELMTDKDFYPALSTWHTMPSLAGPDTKIVWLAADDLGAVAAKAFADPEGFVGRDVALASDVRSIAECRELYRAAAGRPPRSFPVPVWMFERMAGKDLAVMWRWLRTADLDLDVAPTLALHPGAMTVERWLLRRFGKDEGARTAEARDARAAARPTTSPPDSVGLGGRGPRPTGSEARPDPGEVRCRRHCGGRRPRRAPGRRAPHANAPARSHGRTPLHDLQRHEDVHRGVVPAAAGGRRARPRRPVGPLVPARAEGRAHHPPPAARPHRRHPGLRRPRRLPPGRPGDALAG